MTVRTAGKAQRPVIDTGRVERSACVEDALGFKDLQQAAMRSQNSPVTQCQLVGCHLKTAVMGPVIMCLKY